MSSLDDEAAAWIALKLARGVGCVAYHGMLRAFGHPRAVLRASTHALECAGVRAEVAGVIRRIADRHCGVWETVREQLTRAQRCGARVVTWADEEYPANLRHIHDPPPFLFVRGRLRPEDRLAVAIVGSRSASPYGAQLARDLSGGLACAGVTVVSGLARGIDAEAHRAALRANGRTLAVLGSGIDVVYPSEHHDLFMAIARQGAVVSEFLMGTKPDAENFPGRNRIVSGLALGTVIVEATERSGSLITAQAALDQGREVFAVPGPIGARSRGTHRLIREGAKLTEGADDILEEIAPRLLALRERGAVDVALETVEAEVLACVGAETRHVDEVITRSGLGANRVLDALLTLELKGVVQQLPGHYYAVRGPHSSGAKPLHE